MPHPRAPFLKFVTDTKFFQKYIFQESANTTTIPQVPDAYIRKLEKKCDLVEGGGEKQFKLCSSLECPESNLASRGPKRASLRPFMSHSLR